MTKYSAQKGYVIITPTESSSVTSSGIITNTYERWLVVDVDDTRSWLKGKTVVVRAKPMPIDATHSYVTIDEVIAVVEE
jgi:hypothetical protein